MLHTLGLIFCFSYKNKCNRKYSFIPTLEPDFAANKIHTTISPINFAALYKTLRKRIGTVIFAFIICKIMLIFLGDLNATPPLLVILTQTTKPECFLLPLYDERKTNKKIQLPPRQHLLREKNTSSRYYPQNRHTARSFSLTTSGHNVSPDHIFLCITISTTPTKIPCKSYKNYQRTNLTCINSTLKLTLHQSFSKVGPLLNCIMDDVNSKTP